MKSTAGKPTDRSARMGRSASIPPPEPPMTIMSWVLKESEVAAKGSSTTRKKPKAGHQAPSDQWNNAMALRRFKSLRRDCHAPGLGSLCHEEHAWFAATATREALKRYL